MERYYRKIERFKKQNTMLMSNPKWVKFFGTIKEYPELNFSIKMIDSEHIMMCCSSALSSGEIYETGLGDIFCSGPFNYETIEWIFIPIKSYARFDPRHKVYEHADAGNILAKLARKGVFPIEHIIIDPEVGTPEAELPLKKENSVIYDYLIMRGYYRLPAPLPPQPRRGPRAKKMSPSCR
ncbi:MAG: hypothetical protein K0R52_1668 [Alphaproteobacteria bacterium]|jgi:hypothetical protein|nr:hypothetical protein [Alphaproteobacteria bacterium]